MVAIVTGGGSGVGAAIARRLARTHPVAVLGRRADRLAATVAEIEAGGGVALAVVADVTDREAVRAAVREVTGTLGPIDVLVNNAGFGGGRTVMTVGNVDAWAEVLAVNVLGPVWMCAEVVPEMLVRGTGVVVNIASLQASRSLQGCTAYGASKAALMRLTDGLAAELDGTRVIAVDVSPGVVSTAMTREPSLAALLADLSPEEWTPVAKVAELVAAIVATRPRVLNGRFVHAEDDLGTLVQRLETADQDVRRLRLTPMRPDPLLD